jgi:hypothetical protein
MKTNFVVQVGFFLLLAFSAALVSVSSAHAGVVIEQVRYEKGSEGKEKSKIYISKNKIKFEEEASQVTTIFNLDTGDMIQIDVKGKRYVQAKPEDYAKFMNELREQVKRQMESQLSGLPEDQRAQMEEMMRAQGLLPPGDKAVQKTLTIKDTGVREKLAGYSALKFEVYEDGRLDEEIWISSDSVFTDEIDTKKMSGFIKELKKATKGFPGSGYAGEGEEDLINRVYGSGFPLRTVDISPTGSTYIEEVVKVTKAEVPDAEFLPTEGFKKVTIREMLVGLGR